MIEKVNEIETKENENLEKKYLKFDREFVRSGLFKDWLLYDFGKKILAPPSDPIAHSREKQCAFEISPNTDWSEDSILKDLGKSFANRILRLAREQVSNGKTSFSKDDLASFPKRTGLSDLPLELLSNQCFIYETIFQALTNAEEYQKKNMTLETGYPRTKEMIEKTEKENKKRFAIHTKLTNKLVDSFEDYVFKTIKKETAKIEKAKKSEKSL